MKKWIALLWMVCLLCGMLVGCGNKNVDKGETTGTTGSSQSAENKETEENKDTQPTKPSHEHTFGDWTTATSATCSKEGSERRTCKTCKEEELRPVAKKDHTYKDGSNICSSCLTVQFDSNAAVVELGNIAAYEPGNMANYVWDVHIFGGVVYRGAGDYDKNSGDTTFMAFDLAANQWKRMQTATDEAIHRYVEIDGKLYAPGIDSRDSGGWDLGNYYVLENGKWLKVRNVPNGIHCFDMIGFDGKMYIGVATEVVENTVAVSSDKGASWSYLPLYNNDGAKFNTSPYEWSRTYAFVEYNGTFHALLQFKQNGKSAYDMLVFRYEDGKLVYEAVSNLNTNVGRNYWQSAFEWKGRCYIIAKKGLYSVGDFANTDTMKAYKLQTGREIATDALLYNDEMYVLSYMTNSDGSYKTVILKTSTGEANSFTEVVSFDYEGIPYSFDFDGSHFYVGIGQASTNSPEKAGMLLRVKPNA